MNEELVTYIRDHRTTYTREALTAELVSAGHAAADIEAAWAQMESEDAAAASKGPTGWVVADERPYVRGAGALLALVVVVLGYLGSVAWFAVSRVSSSGIVVLLYSVAMLVAGVFVVRRISRASSAGVVFGSFLLAIALYVGLAGACIVGVLSTFRLN